MESKLRVAVRRIGAGGVAVTALLGWAVPQGVSAQKTCNICYTYTGPTGVYGHAFYPYDTPLPPSLTTWVSTIVLQNESNYPEDSSHQGHHYWITGQCTDYHSACYPALGEALTAYRSTGPLTPLARLIADSPDLVSLDPDAAKILVRCEPGDIPAEVPLNWLDWARLTALTADRQ